MLFACLGIPMDALRSLFLAWTSSGARSLERAAALKDFLALVQAAPKLSICAVVQHVEGLRLLDQLSRSLRQFLVNEAIPPLRKSSSANVQCASPYAGEVTTETVNDLLRGSRKTMSSADLRVGILNPGRTGFLSLVTQAVLDWRLHAVAAALLVRNIDFCDLPGARFPPGAKLPDHSPFVWFVIQSASWACVGLFCPVEFAECVRPIEEFSEDRVLWVEIWSKSVVSYLLLTLGGCYPCPGGDLETWGRIIRAAALLKQRFPASRIVIASDSNIHLSYIFAHQDRCECLHCVQKPDDGKIEAWLEGLDFRAFNPPTTTHVSGTSIDSFFGDVAQPFSVVVDPDFVGGSDHKLVWAALPLSLDLDAYQGFGRVAWTNPDEWELGLQAVAPLTTLVCDGIDSALT